MSTFYAISLIISIVLLNGILLDYLLSTQSSSKVYLLLSDFYAFKLFSLYLKTSKWGIFDAHKSVRDKVMYAFQTSIKAR